MAPRCARWRQDGPRMAPGWTQDGSKMAPRWSQDGPEMVPRWAQDGPRMAPGWPQDGFEMAPENGIPNLKPPAERRFFKPHFYLKNISRGVKGVNIWWALTPSTPHQEWRIQDDRERFQTLQNGFKGGSRWPQEGAKKVPRRVQDGPKIVPR